MDVKGFDINSEPTYKYIDEITPDIKKINPGAIIAIGGGSMMDIAKAVAIMLKNPGKAIDYRGMDLVKCPGVPVICYPTTAGTGAEVTHTAALIDSSEQKKYGINGRYVTPHMAVLVPELIFACPKSVSVASGLDAMVHAIEAVTSKNSNKITRMVGESAFVLLYENFYKSISEPENYDARENMLIGSYYAAIALLNASGGSASAISYPVGTHFHVPHGIAGGIFLPHVIEYNVNNGYLGYSHLYDLLPDSDRNLDPKTKGEDFVRKIKSFYQKIEGPKNLTKYGVTKKDISMLTELTFKQRLDSLNNNPIDMDEDGVKYLLNEVIE